MNARSRAAVDPVSLVLIGAVALVLVVMAPSSSTPGKKHFWEFWKKNPVAQVDQAAAAVAAAKAKAEAEAAAAAAGVNVEREKELHVAQEAAQATGSAIAAAQSTTAAGALPVRELDTARKLNAANTQAMDQALGAASPARLRELEAMVRDLNAGVAAGAQALTVLQGSLEAAVQAKAAAAAQLVQVEAAGKAAVTAAETARDAAVKKEQAWALERDGIARQYEQLTFWAKLGGIVVLLIVGYAVFLWIRVRGLANFGKDAVGMTEMLKNEIKARAQPEEFAAIKEKMRTDWMTVHDGSAQLVNKFKAELRI